MWIYKLFYNLKTTGQNLREHRATVFLSLAAVGFTLLLLASYLLLLTNLQAIGERLGKELQIMLYLDRGLSEEARARLQDEVAAREEVEAVEYCSPQEALHSLKQAMGDAAQVLASQILGISRTTLRSKLSSLGESVDEQRQRP